MSDWRPEIRITGKSHTYTVYAKDKMFGREFLVRRDDGKSFGIYESKAAAVQKAEREAGPGFHTS